MSSISVPPINRSTPISTAARALRLQPSGEVLTTSRYVVTPHVVHPPVQLDKCRQVDTDVFEPGMPQPEMGDRIPRREAVDDGLV